jgi:hypothetical protein
VTSIAVYGEERRDFNQSLQSVATIRQDKIRLDEFFKKQSIGHRLCNVFRMSGLFNGLPYLPPFAQELRVMAGLHQPA